MSASDTEADCVTGIDPVQGITLNAGQQFVLDMAITHKVNLFIAGAAGTGKTALLKEIIRCGREMYGERGVAVTSSTGISASRLGGKTLHSHSGAGNGSKGVDRAITEMKRWRRRNWKRIKILIVDEISMITPRFFIQVDEIARRIRGRDAPMGGLQVIVAGDFAQLAPIGARILEYAFQTQQWTALKMCHVSLDVVIRQKDEVFVRALEELRNGVPSPETKAYFASFSQPSKLEKETGRTPVVIASTRDLVKRLNEQALNSLGVKPSTVFHAIDRGQILDQAPLCDELSDNFRSMLPVKQLQLKVGCNVMLIKNIDERLANGTMRHVIAFKTIREWENFTRKNKFSRVIGHDIRLPQCLGNSAYIKAGDMGLNPKENKWPVVQFDCPSGDIPGLHLVSAMRFEEDEGVGAYGINAASSLNTESSQADMNVMTVAQRQESLDALASQESSTLVRIQVPLTLAHAMTIHKCQGMTVDMIHVHLNDTFEDGQVYVAISRCSSPDGLQISGWDPKHVRANKDAVEFHRRIATVTSLMNDYETAKKHGITDDQFFANWRVRENNLSRWMIEIPRMDSPDAKRRKVEVAAGEGSSATDHLRDNSECSVSICGTE